jgi:hypothetical protein
LENLRTVLMIVPIKFGIKISTRIFPIDALQTSGITNSIGEE